MFAVQIHKLELYKKKNNYADITFFKNLPKNVYEVSDLKIKRTLNIY